MKNDKNYKLGFLVVLGINSGLRISDLLSLKYSDLDGDSISLLEKKTNKKRIIRINDNIKNAFDLLKSRVEIQEGFIFTSNQNTVYSTQYVNRKIKEFFGTKNLSVSTHSLRKTFGRQVYINNNETDKALLYLSDLFNHSSPAITKRYLGIRQEELDDIYMSL
ncbi:tyrosine-type recombinase/integrase [Winogradskyella sp.]|uniref:tyrosine-type recombinase/integrase n=1 Tax=Winogradskyella sp. TaxID=1883156 RepID=UPI003F6D43D2